MLRRFALITALSASLSAATAQNIGTGFTYQGVLRDGGSLVTGPRSFSFRLFDAASGGSPIGGSISAPNLQVDNGLFNVDLDFAHAAFAEGARWLEITVGGQTLSPRQRINPSPVAHSLPAFTSVQSAIAPSLLGGWNGNTLTAGVVGATLSGGGTPDDGNGITAPNSVTDNFNTVSGGIGNRAGNDNGTLDDAMFATVGGGYENRATAEKATIAGGFINFATALQATVGGGESNQASGESSTIAGGANNSASDTAATVGGGGSNEATGNSSTISGGNGNTASGFEAAILGGSFNRATSGNATVGGGTGNEATGSFTSVLGGDGNTASGFGTSVGGGKMNEASSSFTTVGGGEGNSSSGAHSTVGGGQNNSAPGQFSTVGGGGGLNNGPGNIAHDSYCTVAGGLANIAGDPGSANNQQATVAGGFANQATGFASFVGGGQVNQATAQTSTVPGGFDNIASGFNAFAAGRNARAAHDNSFVWSDGSGGAFSSSTANQFNLRAAGGTRIFSNSAATVGVQVFPGGNSWSFISDENAKENFKEVDTNDVLERLSEIRVMTWNMKEQADDIVHMGPTAQAFHAAFGLGESERHISSSDADGVALAGIQGLYRIAQDQERELERLRAENDELRARMDAIESMLSARE